MLRDDKNFNTQFVKEVQRHPCLYDTNDPNYCSRDFQERTWNYIAKKVDATVDECKNRWKNLRGGFTRYLKVKTRESGKIVKPYYMLEALQFLLPFTKQKSKNEDDKSYSEDELFNLGSEDSQNVDEEANFIEKLSKIETSTTSINSSNRKRHISVNDPLDDYANKSFLVSNPDLDFFKSLLPDVAEFNPQQKRAFKRKVLQLIDEIASDSTPTPSTSCDIDTTSIDYKYEIDDS